MSAKLELHGFDELERELAALARKVARRRRTVLFRSARQAEAELKAAYPFVTGALVAGVKIVERVRARGRGPLTLGLESAARAFVRVRDVAFAAARDLSADHRTGCGGRRRSRSRTWSAPKGSSVDGGSPVIDASEVERAIIGDADGRSGAHGVLSLTACTGISRPRARRGSRS